MKLFKKAVAEYFKGTKFAKQIKQIKRPSSIDEIIAVARVIDAASSNPSLGIELGKPKIKLLLTTQMGAVLQQQDMLKKGLIKW